MGLGGDAGEREKGWQMKNINASSKKSVFFSQTGGKKTYRVYVCVPVCVHPYNDSQAFINCFGRC